MEVEHEEVLDVRQVRQVSTRTLEVLLKWKGLPHFDAAWEDMATIC